MDQSDKTRCAVAIAALLESYGQEATDSRLLGYWFALSSLSIEQVEQAVVEALRTSTGSFPPPPAKIFELANGGNAESQAISAWIDVQKAMPLGPYKHVGFQDRVINAAIRLLGGWPTLFERCATSESEKWYRLEFIKAYRSFAVRGYSDEASQPLCGLSAAEVNNGHVGEPRVRGISCRDLKRLENSSRRLTDSSQPLGIASVKSA
ncbi:MAG: DUF6475 domain-containing protein [Planctomycetota bacterium]